MMGTCAWAVFRGRERGRCSGDVSMGGVQGDVSVGGVQGDVSVGEPDGGRGRVSMAASMPALACAGVCVCVGLCVCVRACAGGFRACVSYSLRVRVRVCIWVTSNDCGPAVRGTGREGERRGWKERREGWKGRREGKEGEREAKGETGKCGEKTGGMEGKAREREREGEREVGE